MAREVRRYNAAMAFTVKWDSRNVMHMDAPGRSTDQDLPRSRDGQLEFAIQRSDPERRRVAS